MIRGVLVHMTSEQPLMADLRSLPTAQDACLLCTNLRRADGERVTFIDHSDSWFLIPLAHVRFVEIPAPAVGAVDGADAAVTEPELEMEPELALDEDLLRRIRES